jgi:type II secretory pathway pseudopilin PulG
MTTLAKKIIIGLVALVLLVLIAIGILIGAGVTGWKAAVRSGNEAAAVQSVKTIGVVEAQYFNMHNRTFGTFNQLVKDGFDSRFAGDLPLVDGYTFTLKLMPKTSSAPASYTLNADPLNSSTGKNHFYFDSTAGSIRVNADRQASAKDSPLGE